MQRLFLSLGVLVALASLVMAGCAPAAPPPTPTKPAAAPAAPTKAAEPTKPAAAAPAPTKAAEPTKPAAQPTASPTKPAATAAPAKVSYPEKGKAINFIVPWAAGGTTDIGVRALAPALEKELGVPLQIVNRGGASGQIGVTELAVAKPDGYTIGMTNLPTAISTYLDPDRKSAYARKDLVQVANQVSDPDVISVKADSPLKTLKDLVDAAKARPEQVTVSTSGVQSTDHLALIQFQRLANIKIRLVHFEGGAPSVTALLGGHVEAQALTLGNYAAQFKSGEVRFLGVMDTERSKFIPNVPTFQESGYKMYFTSTRGISVPIGTSKEIVDILSAATKRAMENPEVKAKMDEMFLVQRYMDAATYTAHWDEVEAQTRPLIDETKKN